MSLNEEGQPSLVSTDPIVVRSVAFSTGGRTKQMAELVRGEHGGIGDD